MPQVDYDLLQAGNKIAAAIMATKCQSESIEDIKKNFKRLYRDMTTLCADAFKEDD